MSPALLVAIGDNCLDAYVDRDLVTVGGNALNVAANWSLAGRSARYFGAIGADAEGELIRAELAAAGLDAADVEHREGDTAVTLICGEAGERRFLHESLGAGEGYIPSSDRYDAAVAASWVHLGSNANPALISRLAADRVRFSVDLSTEPFGRPCGGAALAVASAPDSASARDLIVALQGAGATAVLVTCAAAGAWFGDGEGLGHVSAAPAVILDTCGAGDSFVAAFIAGRCLDGLAADAALEAATRAAALTCGYLGGFRQRSRPLPAALRRRYAAFIPA